MAGHGVRLTDNGRLVLFRCAPPEDADRLRRTIVSLRASAGAGAVDIVHVTDDGERIELVLSFAGRAPSAPMRADDLAPLAAALAGHLSDLHLRGLAHGAVCADHVLVDADGHVRLCGFGHAHDATQTDDVHAFGTFIRELLDDGDRSVTADALRFHADRCRADVTVRPTMAAIAASLATIERPARTVAATTMTTSPRRRLRVGAAVASAVALALFIGTRPRDSRADDRPDEARTATTEIRTTTTTTTVYEPTRVWPSALQGDGSSWELGDADDFTPLGDWDCDGIETPALVERPSGGVWVVDRWPKLESKARYVTTITGVIDVSVERAERSICDRLVVLIEDGESIRVSL